MKQAIDAYLASATDLKPNSLRLRTSVFETLERETDLPEKPADEITPEDVEAWLATHDWSASYRRSIINFLQTALNLQVRRGRLGRSPLRGMRKPAWGRREHVMSAADQERLIGAASGCFSDVLIALKETGARPSELCDARVENYEDGVIVLDIHKADDSGMPRLLYLSPAAREVVERLIGERTHGLIFRNSRGAAWTADTVFCRFKRLRTKLGLKEGVFPYACRSRFITDALERGIDPITVSELVGHKDMGMIRKHYARLGKAHLKKAAERATKPDA